MFYKDKSGFRQPRTKMSAFFAECTSSRDHKIVRGQIAWKLYYKSDIEQLEDHYNRFVFLDRNYVE